MPVVDITKQTVQRILAEDVVSFSEAQSEIAAATRRRPDKSTMHRWRQRGVGGVKLEAIRLGSQWFTSRQAITRFIDARTAQSLGV
ncbi:MAG: DUF1580 domain-containing protein [Planctomycetota bacterium]